MKLKLLILILGLAFLGFTSQFYQVFSQQRLDKTANFKDVVEKKLSIYKKTSTANGRIEKSKIKLEEICPIYTDPVASRIFKEYGAVFVSSNDVIFTAKCIFDDEYQVSAFQARANPKTSYIGGTLITLQEQAMNALIEANKEAAKQNLQITPRDGSIAGARSYHDTVKLWNSRFFPSLDYWVGQERISLWEAEDAKRLPIRKQVARVLEWESKGLFFSKGLSKSILLVVAAPGSSQHNFMLAFDVEQFADNEVRKILAKYGWFQTVKSDLPHFTYLGVKESELPMLGLKSVMIEGQNFWIPNIDLQ